MESNPGYDKDDILAGDSPPRSKLILSVALAGWSAWVVFLIAMMISVRQSAGH